VAIAVISMMWSFFAIGAYRWWAIVTIVVDGIVISGLAARCES